MQRGNVYKLTSGQQSFDDYWQECRGHAWVSKKYAWQRFTFTPQLYFRNAGWVYVLANEWMADDLLKIGRTTGRIERRMRQLYTTGVPGEFDCLHARWFSDCADAEAFVHDRLHDTRVDHGREFFQVGLDEVCSTLSEYARFIDVHPEHMLDQAHNRFQYAVKNERIRGVRVVPEPPASMEVPF